MDLGVYLPQYRQEIENMAAFWLKFSPDNAFGGYFCALSGKGEVIDTDKYTHWHAQQAYTFAQLHQHLAPRPEWLAYAQQGADFLLAFGCDPKENWYNITDRTGRLVAEAPDVQSEVWAVGAWAKLANITQENSYAEAAKKTLLKAFKKREKVHKKWTEDTVGPRHFKNLAEWTALATALLAAQEIVGEKYFKEKTVLLLTELTTHFWEPRAEVLLTNVPPSGGYYECETGRKLETGTIFEALGTGLELANVLKKRKMAQKIAQQVRYIAQATWDDRYGGFFQWLDLKSLPIANPAANYKLAWVQLSALVALKKADEILNDHELFKLWQRTHDYTWQHFPDLSATGEWSGVLNRQGEPLLELKATSSKNAYQTLGKIIVLV